MRDIEIDEEFFTWWNSILDSYDSKNRAALLANTKLMAWAEELSNIAFRAGFKEAMLHCPHQP